MANNKNNLLEYQTPTERQEPVAVQTPTQNTGNIGLYAGVDGGGATPTQSPESVYLDEIHKAASEKNYKALLQNDIAAYNLKMNTQKYLDNALASQGLGSQGYGTSAHVGASNLGAQLYAQNQEAFDQAESDALLAAQERQTASATENDNQLATFLQYSDGSEESIASYMGKYGYTKNNDGVWVDANGNPASSYIQAAAQSASENAGGNASAYAKYSSLIAQGNEGNGFAVTDLEKMANINGIKNGGEVGDLLAAIQNGEIKNGTVIRLNTVKLNGQKYYVYINGILFPSTQAAWSISEDRYGE